MITPHSALEILKKQVCSPSEEILPLTSCLNLVVAEDIFAPIDVPLFDNSAMDGFAFCFNDLQNNTAITIVGEIQAGVSKLQPLKQAEATRIFTGAPIPANADTVVAQEDVEIEDKILKFKKKPEKGANIRQQGTQTQKGKLILAKNTQLSATYIGFLATFGIKELRVYQKPKIGIIVTGKELAKPGQPLQENQIYESNSIFLKVALQELGLQPVFSIWVDDDKEQLKQLVSQKYKTVDILLFTGGISVGDYDFVKPVLDELGTQELFYKIKQKPGKPMFFGRLENTAVFALPGNPGAVVACFYTYVKPFVQTKMGNNTFEKKNYGILINEYHKKPGLTHFVKAFVAQNKIEILPNQLSYQMDAYAKANAFAILRDEQSLFQIGEKVEIIKFKD